VKRELAEGAKPASRRLSAARACLEAGRDHLAAGREAEGELWLRRAMWCDPCDPDPALELAVRCRFAGQHLKGLHHCEQAEEALRRWENAASGEAPSRWENAASGEGPSRWAEQFRRVLYERSIMCFYAARRSGLDSGADACMTYLCGFPEAGPGWDTALRNLQHYLFPLAKAAGARLAGLPAFGAAAAELCPETPVASSVSVMRCGGRLWANARCVNYRLDENGRFLMQGPKLHTSNLMAEMLAGAAGEAKDWKDAEEGRRSRPVGEPLARPAGRRRPPDCPSSESEGQFTPVRPRLWGYGAGFALLGGLEDFSERAYAIGLEDVRMFPGEPAATAALSMAFVAAQQQFSPHGRIRQVRGRLVSEDGGETWTARDLVRMEPPDRRSACEKNWIPVPGSRWIYGWHPLRICREVPCAGGGGGGPFSRLVTDVEYATPPLWRLFRGSTVPCGEVVPGELWLVVHFKYEGGPLHYVHAVVVLEAGSLRPLRTSVPFYMAASHTVEYCIGMLAGGPSPEGTLTFLFSTHDSNPRAVTVPRSVIRWGPGPVRSLPASTAPLEPATTIVSAFYRLYDDASFRPEAPYEELLAQLVSAIPRRTTRLHMFCDAASEQTVRRILAPLPGAVVHVLEISDLDTWRTLDPFAASLAPSAPLGVTRDAIAALGVAPLSGTAAAATPALPAGRNPKKDTHDYLVLQNAKPEFLARVAAMEEEPVPASLLWIDAGIAKLSGVPEELPFFLDAVTRQGLPPGADVILPGMREPLPRVGGATPTSLAKPARVEGRRARRATASAGLPELGERRAMTPSGAESASEAAKESELARRVTDHPCWRFTGGLIGVRTTSAAVWSERCLESLRWVTARNGGVMTWEINIWAAMEARGLMDASPCAVKWAGCQTHDVGMLHAVVEQWVP
jgi:hypothetical protein